MQTLTQLLPTNLVLSENRRPVERRRSFGSLGSLSCPGEPGKRKNSGQQVVREKEKGKKK